MKQKIMNDRLFVLLSVCCCLLLFTTCTKQSTENDAVTIKMIDTLTVTHSVKGWELYSWPAGNNWTFSIMVGTNRLKTLQEVKSSETSAVHLITISGISLLNKVLAKFPENEDITWIGPKWLQNCWGGNFGDLQLPPQSYIGEVTQYCKQNKLILNVAE
jgi:hypothetical protein